MCISEHNMSHILAQMAADKKQSVFWQTSRDLRHTDEISELQFKDTHNCTHLHSHKHQKHTCLTPKDGEIGLCTRNLL